MTSTPPESLFPATYESLPVTITAVQWDGTARHATDLIDWMTQSGARSNYWCNDPEAACTEREEDHHIEIGTLEGDMRMDKGWWLIRGTEGEFYPCKDSVFQRKYRPLRIENALQQIKDALPPSPTPASAHAGLCQDLEDGHGKA